VDLVTASAEWALLGGSNLVSESFRHKRSWKARYERRARPIIVQI